MAHSGSQVAPRTATTEQLNDRELFFRCDAHRLGREAGPGNLDITLGYVGMQGSSYPINTVFLWTKGPQEAVMNVALRAGASISLREEKLRGAPFRSHALAAGSGRRPNVMHPR
jgi:hypothetical protein